MRTHDPRRTSLSLEAYLSERRAIAQLRQARIYLVAQAVLYKWALSTVPAKSPKNCAGSPRNGRRQCP